MGVQYEKRASSSWTWYGHARFLKGATSGAGIAVVGSSFSSVTSYRAGAGAGTDGPAVDGSGGEADEYIVAG